MSGTRKRKAAKETTCAICFESITPSEQNRTLPCGHQFHAACVDRWTQNTANCPTCRKPVREAVPDNAAWRPGPVSATYIFDPVNTTENIHDTMLGTATCDMLQLARSVLCTDVPGFSHPSTDHSLNRTVEASRQRSCVSPVRSSGFDAVSDSPTDSRQLWHGILFDAETQCESAFSGWDLCYRRTAV